MDTAELDRIVERVNLANKDEQGTFRDLIKIIVSVVEEMHRPTLSTAGPGPHAITGWEPNRYWGHGYSEGPK